MRNSNLRLNHLAQPDSTFRPQTAFRYFLTPDGNFSGPAFDRPVPTRGSRPGSPRDCLALPCCCWVLSQPGQALCEKPFHHSTYESHRVAMSHHCSAEYLETPAACSGFSNKGHAFVSPVFPITPCQLLRPTRTPSASTCTIHRTHPIPI